jgi:hypothetical protein
MNIYLAEDELNILNRIVTAFLEIAEIQALDRTLCIWQIGLSSKIAS